MLQLHIDGQRVNLPGEMSTEYNVLNPFFTNQGDYTLDIDIPLDDPVNALVYHNIHRIDHTRRSSRRTAILSDETGIIVKGQEVLLEVNGTTAKIQIVAGVSELNYIMGDQTLQQLDLWVPFDSSEVEYPPVCVLNDSPHAAFDIIDSDEWVSEDGANVRKWRIVNKPKWRRSDSGLEESHELGMPYMWAVVRRVVQALGFEVGTNVLETDARYKKILMIHGYSSRFIAEKLPAWTVSKFFEEIQKFFNVIITVDKVTRCVDIIHAWQFFSDSDTQQIRHENVITPLDKQFDTDNDLTMVDYTRVRYNFTDRDSNKYLDLDPDLKQVCDVVQAQQSSAGAPYGVNYYNGIWKALYGDDSFVSDAEPEARGFGERKLLRQTFNSEQRTFVWWVNEDNLCGFRLADQFARKTSLRQSAEEVELNIVPARMVSSPMCGADTVMWQYPMPAVNDEATSYKSVRFGGGTVAATEENPNDINADIKSGYKTEPEKRTDTIFVAFWLGNLAINWEDPAWNTPSGLTVPVAAPDSQVQLARLRTGLAFWKDFRQVVLRQDHLTLAINGDYGMDAYSYAKNPAVDATTAYTVKFRCIGVPDIRQVFLIENRKFYCKELKFRIDAGRRSEVCEGTFYPVVAATSSGGGGGGGEGGESIHYVTYNLDNVVIANRINSVVDGEPLHLDLSISGGNATHHIHAAVTMGGVDITSSVFSYSGRTATIAIAAVTGDVYIQAWRGA